MDIFRAFMMGEATRGNPRMVFDWFTAARLIVQRNPAIALAGLAGDEEYTQGRIWQDGKIVEDDYTYLASTWATPTLVLDGDAIPCFVMESETDWDESTKWPSEARGCVLAHFR